MATYSDTFRKDPSARGMEIFEITPVIVGGDPASSENKTLLTREQHIEAVKYWNGVITDLKKLRDGFEGKERGRSSLM